MSQRADDEGHIGCQILCGRNWICSVRRPKCSKRLAVIVNPLAVEIIQNLEGAHGREVYNFAPSFFYDSVLWNPKSIVGKHHLNACRPTPFGRMLGVEGLNAEKAGVDTGLTPLHTELIERCAGQLP
jgi:hypothetical protein